MRPNGFFNSSLLPAMEAVKGGERYGYDAHFPQNASWLHTVFFFSGNLIGPVDYGAVMCSDSRYAHKTTFAHELGSSVLFETGIANFADKSESYLEQPERVKAFLSEGYFTYKDLRMVDGYPGKFAVAARQSEDGNWYPAGIYGDNTVVDLTLDPDFLGAGKSYAAEVFGDRNVRKFKIRMVDLSRPIHVNLLPYGGFISVIRETTGK